MIVLTVRCKLNSNLLIFTMFASLKIMETFRIPYVCNCNDTDTHLLLATWPYGVYKSLLEYKYRLCTMY